MCMRPISSGSYAERALYVVALLRKETCNSSLVRQIAKDTCKVYEAGLRV